MKKVLLYRYVEVPPMFYRSNCSKLKGSTMRNRVSNICLLYQTPRHVLLRCDSFLMMTFNFSTAIWSPKNQAFPIQCPLYLFNLKDRNGRKFPMDKFYNLDKFSFDHNVLVFIRVSCNCELTSSNGTLWKCSLEKFFFQRVISNKRSWIWQ